MKFIFASFVGQPYEKGPGGAVTGGPETEDPTGFTGFSRPGKQRLQGNGFTTA
jgi:hypothetical protein